MSDGAFLLLIAAVGLGIRQLSVSLPIPPEVVQRYRDRQRAQRLEPQKAESNGDEDWPIPSPIFECEDDMRPSPGVNIDGTPMIGDIDINGNPFGVTNHHW